MGVSMGDSCPAPSTEAKPGETIAKRGAVDQYPSGGALSNGEDEGKKLAKATVGKVKAWAIDHRRRRRDSAGLPGPKGQPHE
jgi:hypothetical protein